MRRRPRLVSGVKPTGRLHLGNLEGALRHWVRLQQDQELYCFVADWHAYTTPRSPDEVREDTRQVALDFLAAGLDPSRATIFVQSEVKQHAELYLLLSMVTPVAWLERVPTYKDVIAAQHLESPSHGLLGYPVLQAADVLLYRADAVPVGRDQLPHLELAREIARRFHRAFGVEIFPEPAALLSEHPALPGLDGRKMSKSYGNAIFLSDSPEATAEKIMGAFTTPTKIRSTDPGVPESCVVCQWRRVYDPEGYRTAWEEDRAGRRGCVQNKRELIDIVNAALAPLRARRRALERDPGALEAVLAEGALRARAVAEETMGLAREAMRLPGGRPRAP